MHLLPSLALTAKRWRQRHVEFLDEKKVKVPLVEAECFVTLSPLFCLKWGGKKAWDLLELLQVRLHTNLKLIAVTNTIPLFFTLGGKNTNMQWMLLQGCASRNGVIKGKHLKHTAFHLCARLLKPTPGSYLVVFFYIWRPWTLHFAVPCCLL
jgi:hypothetical protein